MALDIKILDAIYNAGERLIPGETHDRAEIIRHKSSYQLFLKIIESDILLDSDILKKEIKILDLGCGTGHGTFMLKDILKAKIIGIDPSVESIQYAIKNYPAENIEYLNYDAEEFLKNTLEFDYVISRHALEHIENGLNVALKFVFHKRLMVNVPFNESEGNTHHKVHWITENNFELYQNKEFLYESLDGETVLNRSNENPPNSIVCISSVSSIRAVRDCFPFPFPAWKPEFLQELGIRTLETDFNQRDTSILEKESQLERREITLRSFEADLNQRETYVSEKETQLTNHETNLHGLETDLHRLKTDLHKLEGDLHKLEADLHRREINVNQQEAIIENSLYLKIYRKLNWIR